MLLQVCRQLLANDGVDDAHHLVVAELGLGLALELGFRHLDRDHGGEAFTEVVGSDFHFLFLEFLEQAVLLGVSVERACQT